MHLLATIRTICYSYSSWLLGVRVEFQKVRMLSSFWWLAILKTCWKQQRANIHLHAFQVASYPFTTLQPHLGSIEYQDSTFTIADIPGLISGAAENRGLGHSFLRHISRASALAYVVDLSAGFPEDKLLKPWDQLASLQVISCSYNKIRVSFAIGGSMLIWHSVRKKAIVITTKA